MDEVQELLEVRQVRRVGQGRQELLFEGICSCEGVRLWRDGVCEIEVTKDVRMAQTAAMTVVLGLLFFKFLQNLEGIIYNLLLIASFPVVCGA